MEDLRWWAVWGNVAAAVAVRLPGALLGAAMLITFAGILGPDWGWRAGAGWLAAGGLVLTRPGERLAVIRMLRYGRPPQSWPAVDVAQLAPGRRIDVYVAPQASGVFALGGHTVAVGQGSVGAGGRTPELQAATVSAVAQLRAGRTRPDLAVIWWSGPWLFAKLVVGAFLGPRWQSVMRIIGSVVVGMAVFTCISQGQLLGAVLGVCMLADLAMAYLSRRRLRAARPRTIPLAGSRLTHSRFAMRDRLDA